MSTTSLSIQHREGFERNVLRAVLAGACAATLSLALKSFGIAGTLVAGAVIAAALATVKGERLERLLVLALSALALASPFFLLSHPTWALAASGAIAGLVFARSRQRDCIIHSQVATRRLGPLHFVMSACTTSALAVLGARVATTLGERLANLTAPALLSHVAAGATVALFTALGSLATHLQLNQDPVEASGEKLLLKASVTVLPAVERMLSLYRACGVLLSSLPKDASRDELARTLSRVTQQSFALGAHLSELETDFGDSMRGDLEQQHATLKQEASLAVDLLAQRQLTAAATVLEEELNSLSSLHAKRERGYAQMKAHAALLERARIALLQMKSSHGAVQSAGLASVARKLAALAATQSDEAKIANEVATSHLIADVETLKISQLPSPTSDDVTATPLSLENT